MRNIPAMIADPVVLSVPTIAITSAWGMAGINANIHGSEQLSDLRTAGRASDRLHLGNGWVDHGLGRGDSERFYD